MYINMDNTDVYKPALSPRVGTDPFLARISGWVKRENPKMHYIITYINILDVIITLELCFMNIYWKE